MRSITLLAIFTVLLLSACKESPKQSVGQTVTVKDQKVPLVPETSLGKGNTGELMNMLSAYYSLKDALVATNSAKADEAGSRLLSAAELFNHGLGNRPEYAALHPELQIIMRNTDALIAVKNEDIEGKRTKFAGISDAMYKVATLANLKNAVVYHQYCPMAMNDKGAYWLSAESEIKNPYYGKKMLECGEVRDSLK